MQAEQVEVPEQPQPEEPRQSLPPIPEPGVEEAEDHLLGGGLHQGLSATFLRKRRIWSLTSSSRTSRSTQRDLLDTRTQQQKTDCERSRPGK